MIPSLETGEDIAAALRAAAVQNGVPLYHFLRPITADPSKWLAQVRIARAPKSSTKDRVRALIAGEPIPRLGGTGIREFSERSNHVVTGTSIDVSAMTRVDRDPCFRCGARADVGCTHRPWTMKAKI